MHKESNLWKIFQQSIELQSQGKLGDIVDTLKKALRIARKQDYNLLRYQFAFTLHYFYYVVKQDAKAGRYIEKELHAAKALRDIEESIRIEYVSIIHKINNVRRVPNSTKIQLDDFCTKSKDYLALNNITISLYIFPLLIYKAYLDTDFKTVIFYCEQAISLIQKRKINRSQHFYLLMMDALIISKDYEKAKHIIMEAKKKIATKRYSWSVFVYYETINFLHAKEYSKAYDRLIEADDKEQINPAMKEQWNITKGFFQILSNAGLLENTKRFRLSKILNEVPIFQKDKYGNFINLLALKLILGIQENRLRLIEEREAIEKAYQRYCLKGSRERIFIRILLRIPIHRFNKARVEKSCKKDIELLKSMPFNTENLDIIPWPRLINIVIESL